MRLSTKYLAFAQLFFPILVAFLFQYFFHHTFFKHLSMFYCGFFLGSNKYRNSEERRKCDSLRMCSNDYERRGRKWTETTGDEHFRSISVESR